MPVYERQYLINELIDQLKREAAMREKQEQEAVSKSKRR
jgi:heme exporter protein D